MSCLHSPRGTLIIIIISLPFCAVYFMIQAVKCEQHFVCSVSPPRIKYPAVSQRRQHLNDLHQPSVFDMDVINLWGLEEIRLDVSGT